MKTNSDYLIPFCAVPPGEILRCELQERHIKWGTFAKMTSLDPVHLNDILKGKRKITEDIAKRFEKALGISAVTWINTQSLYEYHRKMIPRRRKAPTIKISTLIGTEIRSRGKAEIIKATIDGIEFAKLDFSDVTFITRGFADELYNIQQERRDVSLKNMSDEVYSMYSIVWKGRQTKRVFKESRSEIKEFDDMESLSEYLKTM